MPARAEGRRHDRADRHRYGTIYHLQARWSEACHHPGRRDGGASAEAENINPSYVSRVLRMTLLAPEIVEAILAGQQPAGLTIARAMKQFPTRWQRQRFP